MSTVAIIQARCGSSRLPSKVLADIAGASMLERVVQRVRGAQRLDRIVIATTVEPADDAVVDLATLLGIDVFRGSEDDVLDRYRGAAHCFDAEVIVRLTSDCPLLDGGVIDRVVATLAHGGVDYASNTTTRCYPRGLDCEAFTAKALETAWNDAAESFQRTHVTPFIYQHPDRFTLRSVVTDGDYSHHRWTVDTAEDLELVRRLYSRLQAAQRPKSARRSPADPLPFTWRDVLAIVEAEPHLADINRAVEQKKLADG